MPIPVQTVFIVADDGSARESLEALIHSAGLPPAALASAEDLRRLAGNRTDLPVIMITVGQSGEVLQREAELRALRARYAALSVREREVMALVIAGLLNKQVGGRLGISEITVKAHRGKVMRKMGADSLAGLVAMGLRLRLPIEAGYHLGIERYQRPISPSVRLNRLISRQYRPSTLARGP
jgi:FixJ family two-component response regulator